MEIIDTLTLRLLILCLLPLAGCISFLEDLNNSSALLSFLPPVSPRCQDGGTRCVAESELQRHLFISRNTCTLHSEARAQVLSTVTLLIPFHGCQSNKACEPLPPCCDSARGRGSCLNGVCSQSCWVRSLSSQL